MKQNKETARRMISTMVPNFVEQVRENKTKIEEQREISELIEKMNSGWRMSFFELRDMDARRK
jgi:hypothetical protein